MRPYTSFSQVACTIMGITSKARSHKHARNQWLAALRIRAEPGSTRINCATRVSDGDTQVNTLV